VLVLSVFSSPSRYTQGKNATAQLGAEMKALGLEVRLEKLLVPHWVRGEETAALIEFPGQAQNTTQKIVLCALGDSVATPPEGIEADVIALRNFDELKSIPRDKVAGKTGGVGAGDGEGVGCA